MGGLAWTGYLSHTQVVESSNLSPSILFSCEAASYCISYIFAISNCKYSFFVIVRNERISPCFVSIKIQSHVNNNIKRATAAEIVRKIFVRCMELSKAFE
jgi:hypothetical protein